MTIDIGFDPIIAQLGPFQLGWHGLFTVVAVFVAVWVALRGASAIGLSEDAVGELAIWALAGGVIGARLFHVADHLDYYAARPAEILAVWQGGIAVYGSFIGGIVAGLIVAGRLGLPRWRMLDVAAPAMIVGQAIGRLGCLSNGDAWGRPCGDEFGLCLRYTNPNDLLPDDRRGVPTHAYPLYEIVAEVVLLGVLWLTRHRTLMPGLRFLLTSLAYAAIRFGLTYFREERVIFAGLQEAQVIALATALLALAAMVVRLRTRGPAATADLEAPVEAGRPADA